MGTTSQHTTQQLVAGVAEELLPLRCLLGAVRRVSLPLCRISGGGLRVLIFPCNFLHLTNLMDDSLHMLDGNRLGALCLQVVEDFSHTLLNVVGNLFAPFLLSEITAQRLNVLAQQFVGIFIYLIKSATKIDGNILFHILVY